MKVRYLFARSALLVNLGWFACLGHAQTVVNNTVNNNTTNIIIRKQQNVVILRPSSAIQTKPPAPVSPPPSFSHQPRELLPYMSPRCAQLYEVQLTGFTPETSVSARAGVRDEFQRDCEDAVSEARKGLYQDKLAKYNARQDQKMAVKSTAEQDRIAKEQCSELLRILAGKRKRIDSMTEGEKADEARAEQNYAARCKGA